ncbi:MAG: penicillin-binding protein [Jatrophihabitantaceae bacterium]
MAGTPGSPNPWPTVGKLVAALVAAGVLVAGVALPYVGGLGLAARHEATKFLNTSCNLTESKPPEKSTVVARDGHTVIATIFSQDRVPVPLSDVPTYLQKALVATEDRRFYSHHGVDMRGLIRSAVSTSGGDTQGGSTLTMQYVKQMRYYQADNDPTKQAAAVAQNLNRKIEDAKCALYIENTEHESKATILDNYLNIAFFGENSYGIETAAKTYFNKSVKQLSLPESAMLVGILRAPTAYDPYLNPDAARNRRNQVLQNLVDVGDLSQSQANKYMTTPVSLYTKKPPVVREGCANAPASIRNVAFFCDYVVNWLETVGGISATELQTGGLKIVTTLDPKLQNSTQQRISKAIPASSPMTSVLPVVDPRTGDVLAMATSKIYGTNTSSRDHTHTSLPVFTTKTAFGASTYKLFPLLTALSTGVPSDWQLQTPPNGGAYTPSVCLTPSKTTNGDANETYNANETLQSATAKSSNTFFVGLADQLLGCNLQPIVTMAERLGMTSLSQPSDDNAKMTVAQEIVANQRAQQLVLGDIATSPLELAGAYAAVANNGKFNAPSPILSITGGSGQSIAVKRPAAVQVVSPQVAQQAVQILEGDTQSPGTSTAPFQAWYAQNTSLVAGKTGTSVAVVGGKDSDKNAALWFVGMTPDLVATSALINFDSPNAPATGLPHVSDPAHNAYGAYASGVWLDALEPSLVRDQWSWPDPSNADGTDVPPITGMTLSQALSTLKSAGFKMRQLDQADQLMCASKQPYGSVAFYGPQRAPAGATITVCPSSSVGQSVYQPPPPPPATKTKTKTHGPTTHGSGHTGHGGGGPGGGNGGSPPGQRGQGH